MRRKIGIALLVLFVIFGGGGIYAYSKVKGTMDDMYTDVGHETGREGEVDIGSDPFSVLLLGIDKDEGRTDTGRSDTIIIATINTETKSTILQSVARDTLVPIIGKGINDKINHAYAYGGAQMSINTVQSYLNVPIDYYVEMDMDGLKALIDAVGGVTVENERFAFEYLNHYFPLGTLELNGEEALAYSRMRYEDPEGDWGRQMRQRQVINAIVKKAVTFQVSRYDAILKAMGTHTKTNITMGDVLNISTHYTTALGSIEEYSLQGNGTVIDGIYYLVVPEEQKLEATNRLRTHLGLK